MSNTLLGVAFVVSMLLAAMIVAGYNWVRVGRRRAAGERPRAAKGSTSARELQASAPAELIQTIVRREMAADPSLAARSIDFATAADGSLEIWLDDRSYTGVDQLPDARLRDLITRAAEEFNRQGPTAA